MDLGALQAVAEAGDFAPVKGVFNPGIDNQGNWWLRFELRATEQGAGRWWLAVDAHPLTATVDAWVPVLGPDGAFARSWRASGTNVPVAWRELPVPLFTFQMDLPAGSAQVVYVRLAGTRAIRAQMDVWRLPALIGSILSVTTIVAAMLGAAALLATTAIAVGVWLRKRTLVLLGINTAFMTALQILINGLAVRVMAGLSPELIFIIHAVVLYLTASTLVVTIMAIFRGFPSLPATRRFMLAVPAFRLAGVVAAPWGLYAALLPVLLVLSIVFRLLTIRASYLWMRAGETAGFWSFLGFSVFNVALMAYAARVLGLLPLTAISAWMFPALVLGQMPAIFIGIIVAMRASLRARQELEHQLLALSRRNEKALEAAVDQRTRALLEENEARREAEGALRQALREQRNLHARLGRVSPAAGWSFDAARWMFTSLGGRMLNLEPTGMLPDGALDGHAGSARRPGGSHCRAAGAGARRRAARSAPGGAHLSPAAQGREGLRLRPAAPIGARLWLCLRARRP